MLLALVLLLVVWNLLLTREVQAVATRAERQRAAFARYLRKKFPEDRGVDLVGEPLPAREEFVVRFDDGGVVALGGYR